jgi:hypothetical protein
MKKTIAFLIPLLILVLIFKPDQTSFAADRVTMTLTVTNTPSDGNTFTLNADVRTWAAGVVDPGIQIEEPASIGAATTNLFLQIAANPISRVVPRWVSTNEVEFIGATALAMSGSLSGSWGSITYSTNSVVQLTSIRIPMSGLSNSIRTNDATQLVAGLNSYAQNQFVASLLPDEINASTLNVATASSAADPAIAFDAGTGLFTTGGTPGVYFSVLSNQVAQIDAGSIIQGATTAKAEISASTPSGTVPSLLPRASYSTTGLGASATDTLTLIAGGVAGVDVGSTNVIINTWLDVTSGRIDGVTVTNSTIQGSTLTTGTYSGTIGLLSSGNIYGTSVSNTVHIGKIILNTTDSTSLANSNSDVNFGDVNTVVIRSGPSASFTINSIVGAEGGRLLKIINKTGHNMTLSDLTGTTTNQIDTFNGGGHTTTGNGAVELMYDGTDLKWLLISIRD